MKSSSKLSPKVSSKASTKALDKAVITAALPYANGPMHIGFILEAIQGDIYARFLRSTQKDVLYICASDMHGTPIEVNAKKAGIEPEKFVEKYWKEHQEDAASFLISFDNFYKTHSKENKELSEYFFAELKKKGLIYVKKMDVIYCKHCDRTLPDRYVRGTCPHCGTADQYGDVCEGCGSVLKGTDLLNPKCSICGNTPTIKSSPHYFFKLSSFSSKLKKWINSKQADLQPEVKNWLKDWLTKGLEDWCISRDAPYFGFEIPDSKKECGEVKYFYVWLDAPIGYISSTKNYCDKHNLKWEDYWKKGQPTHFIGKDIVYFHYLFWPAMLMAMNFPTPKITCHGFITVNGQKMSKSRGTFFTAKEFHKLYGAEALRFYYASHLQRKVADVDLNFDEFAAVVNNVLVGKLGNFCYRSLTFAEKNYPELSKIAENKSLTKKVLALAEKVKKNYLAQDNHAAIKNILQITDLGNAYFQKSEPWKSKDDEETKKAVAWCINLARNLAILISPVLPEFSEKVFSALGEKNLVFNDLNFKWKGKVSTVQLLVNKVEIVRKESFPLQLTVGKILEVKDHPNADSLYLLKVDLGSLGKRQVVAGLKKYIAKENLQGRKAVFVANMKPAKLRGEMSEAMVLAADDGANVSILEVQKLNPGDAVHFDGTENAQAEITFEEFMKVSMTVQAGKVFYAGKKLISSLEEVKVHGIKDGAKVR
ncbi:MAG TPA: methionine--tRNA ligase [Candidatus Nanoarchaeia archaeon]|nr:methionine--tRNA ligase [Candidatus Nanoarchaeia archaeon]